MTNGIFFRAIFPIFLLVGMGALSRRFGILREGDERVLNAYVYYFALPALFIIDLSEITFTSLHLRFILAGIIPAVVAAMLYGLGFLVMRFSRETFFLLVISTVFGSLAFFGIPYIMFAFPGRDTEYLAVLSAATISPVAVIMAVAVLEYYAAGRTGRGPGKGDVAVRILKNPLILSILAGSLLSATQITVPLPIATFLHMLGNTTATVALFLLGVFLYGRTYRNVLKALKLSLLRAVFLPILGLISAHFLNLGAVERSTVVLMQSMPVAVSLIVLSERYDFEQETIASLVLVSSLGAAVFLNLWLFLLGRLTVSS